MISTELELASPMQRALYLRALSMSSGFDLEPSEIFALASIARVRRFRRNETLIAPDGPPRATYHIIEGRVGVRFRGQKVEVSGVGDTVGLLATLARSTEVHAQALEDTVALEIAASAWVDVFEDHFGMLERAMRNISVSLQATYRSCPDVVFGQHAESGPLPPRPLDMVQRLLALRRWAVFNQSSLDALAELCRGLEEVDLPADTVIWRQDETPSERALLVAHGVVRCVCDGRVFRVGHDLAIGSLDSIARSARWHDAIAETRVIGLWCPREYLIDLLEDNVDLGMDMLAQMAASLLDARARTASELWVPLTR